MLHGGPGNNEAVVTAVLKVVKGIVKLDEVVGGGIAALMGAHTHEIKVHLQRRFRDEAQDLSLSLDFFWHEVKQEHVEGTDVLLAGHVLFEGKGAFVVEDAFCWQSVGNDDGHQATPSRIGYRLDPSIQGKDRCKPISTGALGRRSPAASSIKRGLHTRWSRNVETLFKQIL